jgi:hypothetical protein
VGSARRFARSHSDPDDPCNDNFEAVVVMTDPHDWFEALQVTVGFKVRSAAGDRRFKGSKRCR